MGDPSGIGPEVILKAYHALSHQERSGILVIGDLYVIEKVREDLGLRLSPSIIDLDNVSPAVFSYGKAKGVFGRASIAYIDHALEIARKGRARAIVTGPINKYSVVKAGLRNFEGHTEYFAARAHARGLVMMLVGPHLRVSLVTRHIALKDVPRSISKEEIARTILMTHRYLKEYFCIRNPRIGVAGLNPHASDGGIFGDEERRCVIPALREVSGRVRGIVGPIAPDVIFHQARAKKFDAVVALYHDQGLIPFKMLYFKNGVNLTLGLPFIRTSPDHGTAFDIAGKGVADPSSMIAAIRLARRLSGRAAHAH